MDYLGAVRQSLRGEQLAGAPRVDYWSQFLQALEGVDADMAVNIEHEDQELDQFEGLRQAGRAKV